MSHLAAPVRATRRTTLVAPQLQRCGDHACPPTGCDDGRLRLARAASGPGPNAVPASVVDVLRSPGQPLSRAVRTRMERQLGHDFSRVRVHADGPAADSARGVRAVAYTVGPHIVFGAGRYSPDSTPGRRLLAHELTHVMQQGAQPWSPSSAAELGVSSPGDAAEREAEHVATQAGDDAGRSASGPRTRAGARVLHRTWDPLLPGECTAHPEGVWLQKVVVDQEKAQSVTLHWSDATVTSSICSTGKGHCCVDDSDPTGTAASVSESRRDGSNATPIGTGFFITDRHRRNGWPFWNVFEPNRSIALHQHHTVTGTPLSHGCVRLPEQTAHEIFCGSRQNKTQVEIRGFSRPSCDEPELRHEWLQDFRTAGREVSDGERPDTARLIRENRAESRRILTEAYGHKPTEAEIAKGKEDQFTIPRCGFHGAEPTDQERRAVPETGAGANVSSSSSELLASSGLERFVPATSRALETARSLSAARTAVQRLGKDLLSAAKSPARGGQSDDRPLFWARLAITRAIRQSEPRFRLTSAERDSLIEAFDLASRGP